MPAETFTRRRLDAVAETLALELFDAGLDPRLAPYGRLNAAVARRLAALRQEREAAR